MESRARWVVDCCIQIVVCRLVSVVSVASVTTTNAYMASCKQAEAGHVRAAGEAVGVKGQVRLTPDVCCWLLLLYLLYLAVSTGGVDC